MENLKSLHQPPDGVAIDLLFTEHLERMDALPEASANGCRNAQRTTQAEVQVTRDPSFTL